MHDSDGTKLARRIFARSIEERLFEDATRSDGVANYALRSRQVCTQHSCQRFDRARQLEHNVVGRIIGCTMTKHSSMTGLNALLTRVMSLRELGDYANRMCAIVRTILCPHRGTIVMRLACQMCVSSHACVFCRLT